MDSELAENQRSSDALAYLERQPARVVPHAELLAAIWPGVTVSKASVYQLMTGVRRLVRHKPGFRIQTIRGRGYRLTQQDQSARELRSRLEELPPTVSDLVLLATASGGLADLRLLVLTTGLDARIVDSALRLAEQANWLSVTNGRCIVRPALVGPLRNALDDEQLSRLHGRLSVGYRRRTPR